MDRLEVSHLQMLDYAEHFCTHHLLSPKDWYNICRNAFQSWKRQKVIGCGLTKNIRPGFEDFRETNALAYDNEKSLIPLNFGPDAVSVSTGVNVRR